MFFLKDMGVWELGRRVIEGRKSGECIVSKCRRISNPFPLGFKFLNSISQKDQEKLTQPNPNITNATKINSSICVGVLLTSSHTSPNIFNGSSNNRAMLKLRSHST